MAVIGPQAALWAALPIGIAFGFVLERAGLGDPRKLAAQFTLTDLTVLKVMLTAILTAALGLFWLDRAALVDITAIYLPPTHLLPQIVGGLVFGAGFVLGGYCPGTSCVAAAAGRGDALALIGGMLAGTIAFSAAFPLIEPFYSATPLGSVTWFELAGLSYGAALGLLVLGAAAVFAVVQRIEGRGLSARSFLTLGAAAALLSGASAMAGAGSGPDPAAPEPVVDPGPPAPSAGGCGFR